jgi:hypothetical protein
VSTVGSQVSAIGLVTNPSLDPADPNYLWTDQGPVIQSNGSVTYNAIDPSVMWASDGRLWMAFGSFWTGIKLIELDPATGKRIAPNSPVHSLATRPSNTAIEAAHLFQRNNLFYLFVNWDACCSGLDSTYNIRVGRSASVTGPYLDRDGVNLANGGGSLLLESSGRFIGPGHAGILVEGETNWFTFHFYDGTNNGSSRLGLNRLTWSADGWPQVTNDWCAFYPFEADAREHLAQFNGQLRNGAAVTNDASRGKVLNLDGAGNHVSLPLSVANAGTIALWAKWNGGVTGQRLFDFSGGIGRYLYLSPQATNGALRFGMTVGGPLVEQSLNAPGPMPTGAWCHVAVTFDGPRGRLYLNGEPIATNNNFTLRPWRLKARTNFVGASPTTNGPAFNGQIDSLRIYGRALAEEEVQRLAQAHPSLAHRYSFTADASDSFGSAHGRLSGAAAITNHALQLNGSLGTYANLPGGLVSGCSAVTLEFWSAFGVNDNGSRVFDFGTTNGTSGSQFLFFSPHTGLASHRFTLSTTAGTSDLDAPGTLDGLSVHVVGIADPPNGYMAFYTNGILEKEMTGSLPPLSGVSPAFALLGRSLFSADAWLNGSIDEFRIYAGRLAPEEIAASFAAGPDALAIPVSVTVSNSAGAIQFSWPAFAVGFVLHSSASLQPSSAWLPVGPAPVLDGDSYRLTLAPTNANLFYRLQR